MSTSPKPSVTVELSPEEEKEFREIFNLVDRDGGGSIEKEELSELLETLGIKASPQELDLMIKEIDENNDGEIQFEEFVAVMSKKVQATYTAEEVKAAFHMFEGRSAPGSIRIEDLERALTMYGDGHLTPEQVAELLEQLPYNRNTGLFNYDEYVALMLS